MLIDVQMDSLSFAIRTVVGRNARHDAAVGLAIAIVFLEGDVTVTAAIVGDKKDIVLSHLSVHHMGILEMPCVKTTVVKVSIRIVGGA